MSAMSLTSIPTRLPRFGELEGQLAVPRGWLSTGQRLIWTRKEDDLDCE
ncbi:MAG: hypothetical protein AAF280_05050 [Pseudomonadota bacterium]